MWCLFSMTRQPWAPPEPLTTSSFSTEGASGTKNAAGLKETMGNPDTHLNLTWVAFGRCLWPSCLHPVSICHVPSTQNTFTRSHYDPFLTI